MTGDRPAPQDERPSEVFDTRDEAEACVEQLTAEAGGPEMVKIDRSIIYANQRCDPHRHHRRGLRRLSDVILRLVEIEARG